MPQPAPPLTADKQESPADRRPPVCSGFPASSQLVGLNDFPTYFGGLEGAIAPLLLASDGAIAPLLLLSAGAMAGAAGAAAGAGGGALSEQAASMTAAAARALRAIFVFIDESPNGMR
ncbi:MAG TPA: hypothetical protein VIH80_01655 [Steroidobacteraceae bacterium]